MTEDDSAASTSELSEEAQDIVEIAKIEREKARERYKSTEGGTFENGRALGAVHAYGNIIEHLTDGEEGDHAE